MYIILSNFVFAMFEHVRQYYASVLNSILIRLVSMVSIVLIGSYLAKVDYSNFLYSYNISMIIAGMFASPIITYLLKEGNNLSFGDYLNTSNYYIISILVIFFTLYVFKLVNVNSQILYIILVFNFSHQFIMLLCIKSKRELLGALVSLFIIITMWCMLWLTYILNYSSFAYFGFILVVLCSTTLAKMIVNQIIYKAFYSSNSNHVLDPKQWNGIKKILRGCFPLVFSSVISGSLFFIYFYYVNQNLARSGADEKSLFNISYQWFQIVIFFSMAVSSKFLFKLQQSNKIFRDGIDMVLLFVLVYIFSLFIFYIFHHFYAIEDYELFLFVGCIVITASLFSAFSNLLGTYLVFLNKVNFGTLCNIIWAFFLFAFYEVFQNYFSVVVSVACSLLFSYICHFFILTLFVWRFSR